jgi:biopolymer transport protein ExbB
MKRLRTTLCALWLLGSLAGASQAQTPPAVAASTTEAVAAPPPASGVDNPYGLKAVWEQGDLVARGTLVVMALMSLGSWSIFVTRLVGGRRLSGEASQARQAFFGAANLPAGLAALPQGGAFHFIAESGLRANEHHEGTLTENIDRATWVATSIQRSVDEVQSRLQEGLAFLATVGSTAPFIGLFGTVWGIYHALTAIGIAGQASIDKVAGPVGESLIMTALGLAVAVPAVLGYNWLVRRNKVAMDAVRGFATDLHGVLMGARATR